MPEIKNIKIDLRPTQVPGEFVVVFTEDAQGIKLVDPNYFVLDGDAVLHLAASLTMAQLQVKQQLRKQLVGTKPM